jgi:L-threonylcarbamoyladenylate synthase
MSKILEMSEVTSDDIAKRIKSGEVFIYPTDTVYGVGCDAMNEEAVAKVFKLKERSGKKPLSVAFHDVEELLNYVAVDSEQEAEIRGKLPGAYTFIVMNQRIPKLVTAGFDTLGVRVPDYLPIREIIRKAETPIITTSANLSGERPALTIHDLPAEILENVDFVLDAGKCGSGNPSTIINLVTGKTLR